MAARTCNTWNAYPSPGWAGRRGRRAGKRPQGMAKRLAFTERRLSFAFGEGTPRPESQAFRQPRGGPMEAALIFRLLFIKEKEGRNAAAIDAHPRTCPRWHDMAAGPCQRKDGQTIKCSIASRSLRHKKKRMEILRVLLSVFSHPDFHP